MAADGALEEQAELYTLDYDVDVREARRRLASQDELGAVLGRLREQAGERFAGMWIEHEGDFRGVIRLTGQVAEAEAFEAEIDSSPAPIEVRTDARFSYAELTAEQAKVQDSLEELLPGAATATDQKNGSVVVYTSDEAAEASGSRSTIGATVQALTDVPVRVRYDPAPTRGQQLYGGDRINTCTSGFSVVHPGSGLTGTLTAGHCEDGGGDLLYAGYAGSFYVLTQNGEVQNPQADIAFFTANDLGTGLPVGAEPEFYGQSQNPSQRTTVTGFTQRGSQAIGTFVCHQGKTTGYSCGQIAAIDSTDCDTSLTGGSCDPVWVRVEGPSLACFSGDSGGPWFVGSSAYGVNHGGSTSGEDPGDCNYAIYTAIDKKTQLDTVVLTG